MTGSTDRTPKPRKQTTSKGYEIPKRPREHVLNDFRKVAVPPPDRGQKNA